MATGPDAYRPDHAAPPGHLLEEYLEARAFSQAEFARRCGRSPKLNSEIVAGKAPIEPRTAMSRVLIFARKEPPRMPTTSDSNPRHAIASSQSDRERDFPRRRTPRLPAPILAASLAFFR